MPIKIGKMTDRPWSRDYVDLNGLPHVDFLLLYPETYGSMAEGNWEELPGYHEGRIGFMMLLNSVGTVQYLMNKQIWIKHWWVLPLERYALYCGSRAGRSFAAN